MANSNNVNKNDTFTMKLPVKIPATGTTAFLVKGTTTGPPHSTVLVGGRWHLMQHSLHLGWQASLISTKMIHSPNSHPQHYCIPREVHHHPPSSKQRIYLPKAKVPRHTCVERGEGEGVYNSHALFKMMQHIFENRLALTLFIF